MKKFSFLYLSIFTLLLIAFTNCSKDEETPTPPVQRSRLDVDADFAALNLSPGTNDFNLAFLGDITWDFRVVAPTVAETETYPLIIDLHGASGGAPDAHQFTDCYVEPGFEDLDVFIISPNGGANQWVTPANQEMVINLLLYARKHWPIDEEKVVVTGYSQGGNGAWFFGETQPDLFSAAIPMASSYTTYSPDGSVRVMPVPMYVIHGENDDLFPVGETEEWVAVSVNAGSDITFVVADGLVHNMPCTYVEYLKDAVTWLVNDVW